MPGNARLLSLLSAFASGRTFSAAELAADFAVTARTIRRDIAELRALGYIIASAPGTAGGYRAESRTMLPPLQLGSGEALATAVGLALLRGAGLNTPHADSAARKLSEMLPAQMRGSLNDIGTAVSVPQGNVPGIDIASVIALASAISGQTLATFDYTVPDRRGRGRSSPRSATAAPRARRPSPRPRPAGRPRADGSSRSSSSSSARTGISSPGISCAATGGSSGSTG
jgi:predicted DNA-binding transcriptional regulator YafY